MPLSPMRQQFAAPGPQIPGQAVLGALGQQGPQAGPAGALGGGLQTPLPQGPLTPGAAPAGPNPQHEAIKRMLGMV